MNTIVIEHTQEGCLHCKIGDFVDTFCQRSTESSEDTFGKVLILLAIVVGDHLGSSLNPDSIEEAVKGVSQIILNRALLIAKEDSH